ncbi:MAG: molybdopterin-binding protein [Pseudolabrys sp.]
MAAKSETLQLISRLTPLADVLGLIDHEVKPVTPRPLDVAAALGRTLAADVAAPARPAAATALADGWALAADLTLGAGGYAPALLPHAPTRVEVGQAMPPGTDSVAPVDAVKTSAAGAEALITVNPGEGVLPAGGDCEPGLPLRRPGDRLRPLDLAAFTAAGLARVTVREPRLRVLPLRGSTIVSAAARLLAGDIERHGGTVRIDEPGRGLDVALAAENTDAIVAIGGTGSGRNDTSVHVLAREGRVAVHGLALAPGETAALGFAGARPVLLLPGRLDAALAVWLTVGRRMLARLAAGKPDALGETLTLSRKVASAIGLAELVPVRRNGGEAEPLASRYLPLSTLTRADGWILVPADSEGYAAGAKVAVRLWP